jgi:hypothetical protein
MMKKIVPLILSLFVIIAPFQRAFAYSGGLLDKQNIYHSSSLTTKDYIVDTLTDGNLANGPTLNSLFKYLWYEFQNPVDITGYQLKAQGIPTLELHAIKLDGTDVLITSSPNVDNVNTPVTKVSNVKKIYLKNSSSNSFLVNEFDVYGNVYAPPDLTPPANVTNLTANNITDKGFGITWTRPADADYAKAKIYLNGSYLGNVPADGKQEYNFSNLAGNTTYSVRVSSVDTSGNESSGTMITVKTNLPPDTTPPSNVTNLSAVPTFNSVLLSWTNPPETDFAKVKIYADGVYQKSVTAAEDSNALFDHLDPETLYTFKVTSVDNDGNESVGASINVKTLPLPEVKNVKSLVSDAKYDRVKLSWELPFSEYFHHVNIFRKVKKEESFFKKLFNFGFIKASAADTTDGFTPMFETNGTYWTDLTVSPETKYEYKLTSENTDGRKSEGVTVEATTPQEPKPEIKGATFKGSPNEDYIVSWQEPTTGTVKVLVGGNEYKTVPAQQGSFTIPKGDMKYTYLGDADVAIQPISKWGLEGDQTKAPRDNLKLPFSVTDLIESSNALFWLIGPFILLALSFLLVPKLRKLIVSAFLTKKQKEDRNRRFQAEEKELREKREKESREKNELIPTVKESRETRDSKEKSIKDPRLARSKLEKSPRSEREPKRLRVSRERTREPRKHTREPRESTRKRRNG